MVLLMDSILKAYFRYRQQRIEQVVSDPGKYQKKLLWSILHSQQDSEYGKKYDFGKLASYADFCSAVPLVRYEQISNDIQLMMDGKENLLVVDKVEWFAKSSGTTTGRSKFIPVTKKYLIDGHLKCTWNAASVIYNEDPSARLFADKNLIMGGSLKDIGGGRTVGDISAILLKNFPKIGRRFSTPQIEVALDDDWDRKIEYIVRHCTKERITLLGGVPTWTLVLFKTILEHTGAQDICEVWPGLRSYLHGGVGFGPYKKIFRTYLPSEKVVFREVYNSSEGYFAIQDRKDEEGMVLLCDHQIFYEFIPFSDYLSKEPSVLRVEEVIVSVPYVMVITNSSGLYRYVIGDVVEFVSTRPYKVRVIGRTEQYINVFGEEVMVANTDQAIAQVSKKHQAQINDYTVAPVFMDKSTKGGHEWAIEFIKQPTSIEAFAEDLDRTLRSINSDYDAKRYNDLALKPLIVTALRSGTLERLQRQSNKFGGQNKFPRLSNDRKILEALLQSQQTAAMHQ